jgi:glycosyltransferase involved in cell wall biosynthesis
MNSTDDRPLVSIGVPVYNGEDTIREALDSILRQTYEKLEIVICDNASTDGTGAICREYAAKDRRIKYYLNETNIGPLPNHNRALELSTGEFFAVAADDDLRPPTAIADLLEGFRRRPEALLVHGGVLWDVLGRDELMEVQNRIDLLSRSALKRVAALVSGLRSNEMSYGLFRREPLIRSKVFYGTHYGNELVMLLRLCFLGPAERIESPMIVYRTRGIPESPMGSLSPLTARNLLLRRRPPRMKCWITLRMGCYTLATCPGKSLDERALGVVAYAVSFAWRYRSHLAREALLWLTTPAGWLVSPLIPAGRLVRAALTR